MMNSKGIYGISVIKSYSNNKTLSISLASTHFLILSNIFLQTIQTLTLANFVGDST